jgi:S-disulfanyl-L-cysteine oxidoreductase SoxD
MLALELGKPFDMRIMGTRIITAAAAVAFAATVSLTVASAQDAGTRTVWDGVYSTAQAQRGAKLFADQCSTCHGVEMKGGPGIPGLVGPEFQFSWNKKPVGGVFDYVKMFMPPGQAGTLSDAQYADIVAAILQGNGFPSTESTELPANKAELDSITFLSTKP